MKTNYKYKLTIIITSLYLIASSPFILGFAIPSIHEGIYSSLYVMVNMPVIYLLGGFADKINNKLIAFPTLYASNLVFIIIALLFWSMLAFVAGFCWDLYMKNKNVFVQEGKKDA